MITPQNSVVVMPTFARPEMLAHALMHLAQAPELPEVRIFLDAGAPDGRYNEVYYCVDRYLPEAHVHQQPEHVKVTSGTWNILKSMQAGYDLGYDYVFHVEEDVMMVPNFIDRHNELLRWGDYKATCGRRIKRFHERYGDMYTNPGSCLSKELLAALVPHINDKYFANTGGYIDEAFGRQYINSSLDDGLIRMVMWQKGWGCGYPDLDEPICAHKGFDWYDELDIYSNRGTLQEKIAGFGRMTSTMKPSDRYAKDYEPCPSSCCACSPFLASHRP